MSERGVILRLGDGGIRRSAEYLRFRAARLLTHISLASLRAPNLELRQPIHRLFPGNPALAEEMYRGGFRFAGQLTSVDPRLLFTCQSTSADWSRERDSLGWLKHFAASKRALHAGLARQLVLDWVQASRSAISPAFSPDALLVLSIDLPPLLAEAPEALRAELLAAVHQVISAVIETSYRQPEDAVRRGLSLLHAAAAYRGAEAAGDVGAKAAAQFLPRLILPDGFPASRNPAQLLDLLSVLIPLREAMGTARMAVPVAMMEAIERMLPAVRMVSHGDGGLACFQGANPDYERCAAVMALDGTAGRPFSVAPHGGFARLAFGGTLVLADTGSGGTCQSPLALEISHGSCRLITGCGFPTWGGRVWRESARGPAAHSTLAFSGEVGVTAGPARLLSSPEGAVLSLAATHGPKGHHERRCFLAKTGGDVRVEEHVSGNGGSFTLRLHLHPSVRASAVRKGETIHLVLPDRSAWQFRLSGGSVELEESIYLGEEKGLRKTQQIVMRGIASEEGGVLSWALTKLSKSGRREKTARQEPALPF